MYISLRHHVHQLPPTSPNHPQQMLQVPPMQQQQQLQHQQPFQHIPLQGELYHHQHNFEDHNQLTVYQQHPCGQAHPQTPYSPNKQEDIIEPYVVTHAADVGIHRERSPRKEIDSPFAFSSVYVDEHLTSQDIPVIPPSHDPPTLRFTGLITSNHQQGLFQYPNHGMTVNEENNKQNDNEKKSKKHNKREKRGKTVFNGLGKKK